MLTDLFHHPDDDHELTDDHQQEDVHDPKIPQLSTRKPAGPRAESGFVGLENQGATCYLNSLIQVMYMTPELRQAIYALDPIELGINLVENDQKEEKEKSQKGIVEPDENMVEILVAMGVDEIKAKFCLVQTKNKGVDDAFDYLDRLSEKTDIQAEMNKLSAVSKKKRKPKYIPLELQRLFSELQLIDRETVSTQDLTTKGFQWQSAEGHIQHDAHELNRLLIDALERSLKKTTNGERLCQNLYEGKVVNQILCSGCMQISSREESFYDLNMQVTNCENLAVALHQYCEREILDNDSAYQCDRCKAKMKAYRSTKLQSVPKILTFSCNRFKIDRSTNWQRVKITSKSEYPLLLNMNHFIFDYDVSLYHAFEAEKNAQSIEAYDENLQSQARESMLFYKNIIKIAEEFLHKQLIEQCGVENIHNVHKILENFQLNEDIYQQFQEYLLSVAPSTFCEHQDNNYLLHAIIIHRGSAYSGHYFAYIRDNLQEGKNIYSSQEFNVSTVLETLLEEKNFLDDGSGTGSGGNGSGSDKKFILTNDYIFMKDENTFYISTNHLIGRVITIFRHEEELFKAKNKKKKLDKDKPFFLAVNAIAREIAASLRQSNPQSLQNNQPLNYAKVYKAQYGNLEDFMKKFSLFFSELQPGQYYLNPLNYYLLQENDFEIKLAKLRAEERSLKQQQQTSQNHHDAAPHSNNGLNNGSISSALADPAKSFREAVISEHNRSHDDNESVTSAGEWQVANNKKHRSKKSVIKEEISSKQYDSSFQPSSPGSTASNPSNSVYPQKTVLNSEEAMITIKKELIEILLHQTIGNFYEFNDSHVSLITYDKIEKAFEGINSSYLLVYRKLDHIRELFNPRKLHPESLIPIPPTEWKQRIQEKNICLEMERKTYEDTMKNISIIVYTEEEVNYQTPFFNFPTQITAAEAFDSPHSVTKGQIITIDSSITVKDVLEMCTLPERYQNLKTNNTIVLSKLERYAKAGYYASDGLDFNKTLHDHKIKTNDLLLVWSPQTAATNPQLSYFYGIKSKPVELNLSYLYRSPSLAFAKLTTSANKNHGKSLPNPNIHVKNKYDSTVYLPNHFTLLEVLLQLSQKFSIAPDELILSGVIPNFNSKTILSASSVTASSGQLSSSSGSTDNTRVVIIYKDLKYQLNQKQYYQLFVNCPIEITEETSLQDLWFLREFYVEHAPPHSANTMQEIKPLSEDYHQQRSQVVTIPIEITESIRELLVKDHSMKDVSTGLSLDDRAIVQLKVVKSSTVLHVKEELLHYFGLTDTLPTGTLLELLHQTQFRLSSGAQSDDILLDNEDVTISSLGLKSRSKLLLENKQINELNPAATSSLTKDEEPGEDVTVIVKLIHGNITDVNYYPNDSGFELREVTVTINRENSVRELRDILGQQLLQFPENWTLKEEECLANVNYHNLSNPFEALQTFILQSASKTEQASTTEEPNTEQYKDAAVVPIKFLENYKGRRLRATNWMKEFAELLPERNKKNEIVLIKDTNLKNQDVLIFEEGILPRKGIVNLQIYFWRNTADPADSVLLKSNADELPQTKNAEENRKDVPEKDKDEFVQLEAKFEEVKAIKASQLLLIGEINFPYNIEPLQLYESVLNLFLIKHDKLLQSVATYQAPQDIYHLLLREFRFDLLPGKCFWLNSSTSSSTNSTSSLGVPINKMKTNNTTASAVGLASNSIVNPEKSANSVLKKLGIKNESKSLIVETLQVPQAQVKSLNYSYQVWVQRLLNPLNSSQGKAEMSPRWPPLSITVNGGIKPSIGHLLRPIGEKFPDLNLENIIIYKYNPNTNEWQLIKSPSASFGSSASNKATTKANAAVMDNIKDGDLLCVFSQLDLIETKTMNGMTSLQKSSLVSDMLSNLNISLAEDLFMQRLNQEAKQNGGSAKDKKKKGGKALKSVHWLNSHLQNKLSIGSHADGHPKLKRKEYALTLRTDFDSSEEEEEP